MKVNGNGYAYISASVECDSKEDLGSVVSYIKLNGKEVAYSWHRLTSAVNQAIGTNCSAFISVKNDDTITIFFGGTKNGSKKLFYHTLCIGCSVEKL